MDCSILINEDMSIIKKRELQWQYLLSPLIFDMDCSNFFNSDHSISFNPGILYPIHYGLFYLWIDTGPLCGKGVITRSELISWTVQLWAWASLLYIVCLEIVVDKHNGWASIFWVQKNNWTWCHSVEEWAYNRIAELS